ncbi:MAG: sulfate ABC transporter ATP-binding protein [Candidatus Nephthysia bennettiae]|uniref:ABC transporter ATP-binding protein n=1 Tax=Candidatus Nephthysia bennettiae TaxID=3127016 RepID=A0A934KAH9_9BACT|nr:ABC transporter ATP-binding protein [Candidatus Dormibacteraeota bacterium]MBJ7614111.1 ABC transporter ATP-binding protein [Candidatus Dormibacteraeota bacterium]PZR98355.1 MAG: sulfate ABC transporter ATP-binding protein [Candidatus Dormibacteraeota bacterium]
MTAAAVSVNRVTHAFGQGDERLVALSDVSFELGRGEFACLVGASGSGKSTLLNLVARLDPPTAGRIDTFGSRTALLFQEAALFPWLTAAANVELPLRLQGVGPARRREEARRLLSTVGLADFADSRPHELSGGMRQRVALARALAQDAAVLLMDEPFGALDAITRDLLHDELERIWQERRLSILFVTHNAREAVRLGDRVLVFSSRPGRVASEFRIDLPRPRRLDSPEVARLAGLVSDRLRDEVLSHSN